MSSRPRSSWEARPNLNRSQACGPACRRVMKTTATSSNAESIIPAVHLEFIQNQLENPSAAGPEEVEQYHRALFLHHHAVQWEKFRQQAKTHEDRLLFLEGQLRDTDAGLGARTKLVPVMIDGE